GGCWVSERRAPDLRRRRPPNFASWTCPPWMQRVAPGPPPLSEGRGGERSRGRLPARPGTMGPSGRRRPVSPPKAAGPEHPFRCYAAAMSEPDIISIRGAREHNLKNLSLDLPKKKLVVFTGVSGSGKSSLAFDTLFAEGQRRYVE